MCFWCYGFDDNNDEVDGEDNDHHHRHHHQLTMLYSIVLQRFLTQIFPLDLTVLYYCYSTTIIIIVISAFIIISISILFSSLISSHPQKSLYHTHVLSHFCMK
jgi:hypothetical protein